MNPAQFNSLLVPISLPWMDAMVVMDTTAQGVLLAVDTSGKLERTITDGDLRRAVLQQIPHTVDLAGLPGHAPIVATEATPIDQIKKLMDANGIAHIPVVDFAGRPVDLMSIRDVSAQIWLSSPHLGQDENTFVEAAFRTNWIAPLGPNVDGFEREVASHVGAGYAAALTSGTAAIHLALILLGVKSGDTVFCSSLTFVGSCNPILYCGATPVFLDVEPETWNMSPAALERAFDWAMRENRMPRCVILVNLYGQSADMDALLPICERYGVPVLEDAAESLGGRYKGRSSGTFGRIGVYSFNGNKIITTSGGGMLVADDADLVTRARKLSTQARDPAPHYQHSEIGFNYRMSNVLAGIGRGQLRVLDQRVDQRRRVFARYQEALVDSPEIQWMPEPDGYQSTRWLTCFTLDGPDASVRCLRVMSALARHLIEARPVWKPMHLQPLFAGVPYFSHTTSTDVSERLFRTGICLPSGSNLNEEQQDRVIDQLRHALTMTKDKNEIT